MNEGIKDELGQSVEQQQIGLRMATMAALAGKKQTDLANKCGVSRLTIHRFFKGHSEIKASDFIRLMALLGVNLDSVITDKMQRLSKNSPTDTTIDPVLSDVMEVLCNLEKPVRRTLIESLLWWAEQNDVESPATERLRLNLEARRI